MSSEDPHVYARQQGDPPSSPPVTRLGPQDPPSSAIEGSPAAPHATSIDGDSPRPRDAFDDAERGLNGSSADVEGGREPDGHRERWRVRRALASMRAPRLRLARSTRIVVGLLIIAAALRLYGLDWDQGHHLHPDERFVTGVAAGLKLPSLDHYFDTATSPLNPNRPQGGSYVYGTWPLFVVRVSGEIVSDLVRVVIPQGDASGLLQHLRELTSYDNIYLLGRAWSAVADVATIFVIYLIGRRLYGAAVGVLAAALATFTVLQIQTAHFFTVEAPLTLFVTLAFYYAVRASASNALRDWSLFGVMMGLAAATKPTALMLAVVAGGAAVLLWYRTARLGAHPERRHRLAEDIATGLFSAGALAFLAFRLTQPYTFNGPGIFNITLNPRYVEVFNNFQHIGVGDADVPFNEVWAGTTPYLWQLAQMFLWGMGPPFAVAAWGGVILAGVQFVRDPRRYLIHSLGLLWVLANFAYWGMQFTKLMRYMLPIYPQLTIFAALLVVTIWQHARRSRPRAVRAVPGPDVRGAALQALRIGGRPCGVVVVGWTALYAIAFMAIYTRPVTRVAASEWIYANVPAGASVASEHWDDRLPLGMTGHQDTFKAVELPLYADETPESRATLISRLDQSDYIVESSNRLYGSIPRNPRRYPMGTRYYQALFDGELGFDRVAEFTSRPTILGFEFNDDAAEESFTVYDHPKVTIFRKGDRYTSDQVHAVLDAVPVEQALRGLKPIRASSHGLLLDAATAAADRAGGTWSAIFDRGSPANSLPIPIWYATVEALSVLALPLGWLVFRRLGDAGYPLAKTIGILHIAYVPWLLGSLHIVPYTTLSIWIGMASLAIASGIVLMRHRRAFLADYAARGTVIVATETIFLVTFLGFTLLRSVNPDLWHSAYGGEKPMDFAYLNATIKTTWFPPYDPWFAGGYLNYYYFGYVIVASLIKLTGIVPWVAYNLAIPTIAALVAVSIASAIYNLLIARPDAPRRRQLWAIGGGVAGVLLGIVGGNLHPIGQIFTWFTKLDPTPVQTFIPGVTGTLSLARGLWIWATSFGNGLPPLNFDFWAPTRVISTEPTIPITEFPYFTFLYGDLHAHMIAMPVGLLAVALVINLVRQPAWIPSVVGTAWTERCRDGAVALRTPGALTLFGAALSVGIARMANSWDFPTYLGLTGAVLLLSEALRRPVDWWGAIIRSVVLAGAVVVASQLLIFPYLQSNELFYTGVEINHAHTIALHYVTILGSFLAVFAVYLGFQLWGLRGRIGLGVLGALGEISAPTTAHSIASAETALRRSSVQGQAVPLQRERSAAILGAVAVFLAALLAMAGLPVIGISLLFVAAMAVVALLRPLPAATAFAFLLAATGFAITSGVEVFVLKGDLGRMNTVFKFYLQAWLFFAIVAGAMLALLTRRAWGSNWLRHGRRRVVAGALALILAIPFLYTLLGTPVKVSARFVDLSPTIDGMAYMRLAHYGDDKGDMVLPDDYAAINWMLDHIQGSPVIVEGIAPLYHWRSRVSVYTGLPTVIGWDWHQTQQRGDFAYMIEGRLKDTDKIFTSTSPEEVRQLLDRYQVAYVYVGGLERAYYPATGIQKFERMVGPGFEKVYEQGVVTIYHVVRSS